MIKNEEVFLRSSLESIRGIADEVIIGDTGSTDRSLLIADDFQKTFPNSKIFKLKWIDDFAKTRNQIASKATHPWIFFIDGDEVLDPLSAKEIKSSIEKTETSCFSLIQRNYCRDGKIFDAQLVKTDSLPGYENERKEDLYFFDNWMERLYNRSSGISYEGRIHESLIPSCRRRKKVFEKTNWVLHHYGRLKDGQQRKLEYYLQLSREKWKEDSENPVAWTELMVTLSELELYEEAFQAARLGYRLFSNEKDFVKTIIHIGLKVAEYAQTEVWIRHAMKDFSAERIYFEAQLTTALLYQGKLDECYRVATQVIGTDPENFLSHLHLGVIEFERKNWKNSEAHLLIALRHKPSDRFIQDALQKIAVAQQNH